MTQSAGTKAIHEIGVRWLLRRLKANGIAATRTHPRPGMPQDVLVAGRRIAVRASRTMVRRHHVCVNGHRYLYRFTVAAWTLHVHNRRCPVPPDWWALVDLHGRQMYLEPGASTRKTVVLRTGTKRKMTPIWHTQNRWDLLARNPRTGRA